MSRSSPWLVLPVIALLASACGSGSTKSSSSSNPPSSGTSTSKSTPAASSTAPSSSGYGTPQTSTSAATSTGATAAGTKISSHTISGLGPVLVDAQGKTLYIFEPDNAKAMTCKGACAAIWPPLKLGVSKPVSAGSVKSSLLGSDPDPEGGRVVTYAGWPLYGYVGDPSPGIANGQAKNLTGGLWYVISPSGQVIKKAP